MKLEKILEWAVPALLSTGLTFLMRIQGQLTEIATSVAVMAENIHLQDKRLDAIEAKVWR